MADEIDAMALYRAWQQLDNGSCAQKSLLVTWVFPTKRLHQPIKRRDIA